VIICPSWRQFKDSVAAGIWISHSQPFRNSIVHFLVIVDSAISQVAHGLCKLSSSTHVVFTFALDVPERLMLSSWTSNRPFTNYMDCFQTCCTLITPPPPHTSIKWRWISMWKTYFAHKRRNTVRTYQVILSCQRRCQWTSTYPLSQPLTFVSYFTCNHYCKCCLIPQPYIFHTSPTTTNVMEGLSLGIPKYGRNPTKTWLLTLYISGSNSLITLFMPLVILPPVCAKQEWAFLHCCIQSQTFATHVIVMWSAGASLLHVWVESPHWKMGKDAPLIF
jgi:hypothetical protein